MPRTLATAGRSCIVIGSFIAAVAAVGVAPSARAQDATANGLVGNYRLAAVASELRALEVELDRVADEFNVLIRAFARSELHSRIVPYPFVVIDRQGDHSRVRLGDVPPLLCDGAAHPVRGEEGEEGQGVCRVNGERLEIRVTFDTAIRQTVIERQGETLQVRVRLQAEQLPDTVTFEVTYRRQ